VGERAWFSGSRTDALVYPAECGLETRCCVSLNGDNGNRERDIWEKGGLWDIGIA
jgi:hypothetical protein